VSVVNVDACPMYQQESLVICACIEARTCKKMTCKCTKKHVYIYIYIYVCVYTKNRALFTHLSRTTFVHINVQVSSCLHASVHQHIILWEKMDSEASSTYSQPKIGPCAVGQHVGSSELKAGKHVVHDQSLVLRISHGQAYRSVSAHFVANPSVHPLLQASNWYRHVRAGHYADHEINHGLGRWRIDQHGDLVETFHGRNKSCLSSMPIDAEVRIRCVLSSCESQIAGGSYLVGEIREGACGEVGNSAGHARRGIRRCHELVLGYNKERRCYTRVIRSPPTNCDNRQCSGSGGVVPVCQIHKCLQPIGLVRIASNSRQCREVCAAATLKSGRPRLVREGLLALGFVLAARIVPGVFFNEKNIQVKITSNLRTDARYRCQKCTNKLAAHSYVKPAG
jgi:hypothetical protein